MATEQVQPQLRGEVVASDRPLVGEARLERLRRLRSHLDGIVRRLEREQVRHLAPEDHERLHGGSEADERTQG